MIDLRSDTITVPDEGMREAMFTACVGDDVFGEDPTVNELEVKLARMFGMEAGLYVSSGTMSNQIAIKVHTRPGDDVICDFLAHIYQYEGGGIAFNSGCSVSLIRSETGQFTAEDVEANIYPDDVHKPVSRLVAIENSCNKGGGTVWNLAEIKRIRNVCDRHGLKLHLDGARLFNALVATGEKPEAFGEVFDTISICLSKGLGAPVGSVLLGTRDDIKQARRIRKVLGGGMRQAGIIAAAGIYALDHNVAKLKDDHRRAKSIEETLTALPYIDYVIPVETNIVIFRLSDDVDAQNFLDFLAKNDIRAMSLSPQMIRFVTHLNFTDVMLETTLRVLNNFK